MGDANFWDKTVKSLGHVKVFTLHFYPT